MSHSLPSQAGPASLSDPSSHSSGLIQSNDGEQPRPYRLHIKFTGSGSEYFRIWIVNMLLMMVTLGIYYPWAKVRRLRYFHGNTVIDGEPLGFHADPKKMLKGYFLVGLMFSLYSAAGKFSAVAGLVAFLIVMAIWPALLKSSMQFRLANTSWRGMRFRFKGTVGGAYQAVMPLFVPSVVILAAFAAVADPDKPPRWYLYTIVAVFALTVVVMPWLLWNLKKYQHNHYALASLQTTFKASLASFYGVFFKTLGVMLLPLVLAAVVIGGLFFLGKFGGMSNVAKGSLIVFIMGFGFVALLASVFVLAKPYMTSRLQNLLWTRTGNTELRFKSDLRFKSLLWLSIKNWLLVVLTLGLYWPFAAVATARMRLEAVTVKMRQDPELLISQIKASEGEAAGDAAGDLFGLDIGF
ncbi:MAG: YjgN family protein [Pseudomonadota bacterium]